MRAKSAPLRLNVRPHGLPPHLQNVVDWLNSPEAEHADLKEIMDRLGDLTVDKLMALARCREAPGKLVKLLRELAR